MRSPRELRTFFLERVLYSIKFPRFGRIHTEDPVSNFDRPATKLLQAIRPTQDPKISGNRSIDDHE